MWEYWGEQFDRRRIPYVEREPRRSRRRDYCRRVVVNFEWGNRLIDDVLFSFRHHATGIEIWFHSSLPNELLRECPPWEPVHVHRRRQLNWDEQGHDRLPRFYHVHRASAGIREGRGWWITWRVQKESVMQRELARQRHRWDGWQSHNLPNTQRQFPPTFRKTRYG